MMHPFRHSRWAPCSPPAPRGGARTCGLLLRRPLRSGTDRTAGTVPPTAAAMDDQQQPRAGARCYCFVWIARVRVTRQPLPECRESAVRGREAYPCFCRREGLRRERSGDPVRAETETVACRGSTRPAHFRHSSPRVPESNGNPRISTNIGDRLASRGRHKGSCKSGPFGAGFRGRAPGSHPGGRGFESP